MPLKKSRRKKNPLPQVEVNIISLMDILTTMLFFLLVFASFANYSVLKSTALVRGQPAAEDKPTFALEIRMKSKNLVQVWLGPIEGLKIMDEKNFRRYMGGRYQGSAQSGYTRDISHKDPKELVAKLQEVLVPIKRAFPHEMRAVLSLSDQIEYQQMIDMISGLRQLNDGGQAFEVENFLGKKEMTRVLFSQVIVSEMKTSPGGA